MSGPVRVVLADDHRILLDGLRRLIAATPDLVVVGTAADAEATLAVVREHRPDVLVLDISMPGGGIEVMRRLREMELPTRVVVLTMYDEERYALEAVHLGACGYVPKSAADRDLLEAIRSAVNGNGYLTPRAVRVLLESKHGESDHPALSPRERQVLRLTARGYSNHEIGERLFLSAKTVDTYRARVMAKLDLHHRADLVTYALAHGLIE